jgi:hypothetical protein
MDAEAAVAANANAIAPNFHDLIKSSSCVPTGGES